MKQNLSEIQKVLLYTFKAFTTLCKKYNIKYYAAFGTALGAIRHHGFIPWDDDIDVYIPRNDYNKFIELKNQIGDDYKIIDIQDDKYFMYFAKFINNKTTIWEKEELPFVYGVFIDIFPIDFYNEDQKEDIRHKNIEFSNIYKKFFKAQRNNTLKYCWKCIKNFSFIKLIKTIETIIIYHPNKKLYKSKLEKLISYFANIKGNYLCRYSPDIDESSIYPINWFAEGVEFPFEDTTIILPKYYDLYLKKEFGNYMKLPKKEKQVSNHDMYFIDLHHKYTIKEIQNIMK